MTNLMQGTSRIAVIPPIIYFFPLIVSVLLHFFAPSTSVQFFTSFNWPTFYCDRNFYDGVGHWKVSTGGDE